MCPPGPQYVYDYTIETSDAKRHLRSLFTIKADAYAPILVSLTAQCLESKHGEFKATARAVIDSFKV